MGVFGLQTLVGWHRDPNPGPPACESGVVAIRLRGIQLHILSILLLAKFRYSNSG